MRNFGEWLAWFYRRGERNLIRVIVLASVALVIVQFSLGSAQDPVKFYMAVAQKVEIPSLDMTAAATVPGISSNEKSVLPAPGSQTTKVWKITLKAVPAAPVRVWQNGRLLGVLTRGEQEFSVQSGQIQLDGTNVGQFVRVQVIKRDPLLHDPRLNQSLVMNKDVQILRIGP